MIVVIGADHAGVAAKRKLADALAASGQIVEDVGSYNSSASDDYPDFAKKVVKRVLSGGGKIKGILLCTTGTGMVIAANRHKGIRCSFVYDSYMAKMARHDNDANIIALRSKGVSHETRVKLVHTWLKTPFSNIPRHKRRIQKLDR